MSFIGPEPLAIISGPDLLVIAVVLALLFGGKKIPDLAKGLGQGIRNFKNSVKDEDREEETKPASETDK